MPDATMFEAHRQRALWRDVLLRQCTAHGVAITSQQATAIAGNLAMIARLTDDEEPEAEDGTSAGDPEKLCPRCEGCGRLADTERKEPWIDWLRLPHSSSAVMMGLVKPVPCPHCCGTGRQVRRVMTCNHADAERQAAQRKLATYLRVHRNVHPNCFDCMLDLEGGDRQDVPRSER